MESEKSQEPVETQIPQNNKPDSTGMAEPYPGFGKRHDIFYQYQPPEVDTAPALPAKPYIPPPPAYLAQLPPEETYIEEPSGGHKKLIIVFVVMLTVMAGAIIYLVMFGTKKPVPSNSNKTPVAAVTNPDIVNTSCYNFTLPKPHTQASTADSCSGSYTSNGNDIIVTPIMYPYESLDAVISAWKSSNPNNTIVSENPATFGTYTAVQLFWNPPSTPNETDMTVLTYTQPDPINPKYTNNGAPIYSFEIDGRYDSQSSSKTVYDSILSSWVWK